MPLYALHHDWIDGHAMQGPVGIWNEHGQSHYPATTEHLRARGHRASGRPVDRSWAAHLEYLTDYSSAYNANWSIVESDLEMDDVIVEKLTEFLSEPHEVLALQASGGQEADDPGVSEESGLEFPEPAERFQLAQTWWIASEFVRRHPDWAIRFRDDLSYLTLVGPNVGDPIIVCNPSKVHMFGSAGVSESMGNLLSSTHPHELVKRLGSLVGDPAKLRAPASTPRTLAYRVMASLLTMTVNDRSRWEVRNEILGDDGLGDGPVRAGLVASFPAAQRAIGAVRSEPWDLGEPARHFWAILRDDVPLAIVSTGGRLYKQDREFDLATEYQANGRRVSSLVVAVLGEHLP